MNKYAWILGGLAVTALLFAGCSASQPSSDNSASTPQPMMASPAMPRGQSDKSVPPYHESAAAAKPFPRLLPPRYFSSYPIVALAYQTASEMAEVIAQQPCYCNCDKFGHSSLLDCYASDHGAS